MPTIGLPIYEMAIEWDILSGAQMDTGLTYAAADDAARRTGG